MTRLDSGGQSSRSQQAVKMAKVSTSTLGHWSLFSSYVAGCIITSLKRFLIWKLF